MLVLPLQITGSHRMLQGDTPQGDSLSGKFQKMVFLSHQLDKPHFPGEKQYLEKVLYKQSFLLMLLWVMFSCEGKDDLSLNHTYKLASKIMLPFPFPFLPFSLSFSQKETLSC